MNDKFQEKKEFLNSSGSKKTYQSAGYIEKIIIRQTDSEKQAMSIHPRGMKTQSQIKQKYICL